MPGVPFRVRIFLFFLQLTPLFVEYLCRTVSILPINSPRLASSRVRHVARFQPSYFCVLSLSPNRLTTNRACCAAVHYSGSAPSCSTRYSRLYQPTAFAPPTPTTFCFAITSRPLRLLVSLTTTFVLRRSASPFARPYSYFHYPPSNKLTRRANHLHYTIIAHPRPIATRPTLSR